MFRFLCLSPYQELLAVHLGHLLDAHDPVLDQAVVVVGHGGADTTALVVTAHDDILDLRIAQQGDIEMQGDVKSINVNTKTR